MPNPTWELSVDWENGGDFTGTNEDVTAYVLLNPGIQTFRGRDNASQLTGRSIAGSLTCLLDNTSGLFSSFNASGALYGSLLPGRPVRLRGVVGVTTYDVWYGYLESLTPETVQSSSFPVVRLRATGALAWLANPGRKVSFAMQGAVLTGTAIGALLDEAGWSASLRDLDAGNTTMTRFWVDRTAPLTALRKAEETEGGFLWEKADGKVVFDSRWARMTNAVSTSVQQTYSDDGSDIPYASIRQEDAWADIYNRLETQVQLYTVGSLAVLWTLAATGADSPVIAAGESRDFWANYPNPASAAADGVAVDAWTTPVITTDFLANAAADGSGTNLSASITVTATKFANAMKINLANGAAVPAFITFLQARGTPVLASDPLTVVSEDSTSQTAYGERAYPNPSQFTPDLDEAEAWNGFILNIFKDPQPRLQITIQASKNTTMLADVLTRDIGHRVNLEATGARAKLGIDEDFFIEAIRHRAGAALETTFDLSPASAWGGFIVIDTDTLDGPKAIGF